MPRYHAFHALLPCLTMLVGLFLVGSGCNSQNEKRLQKPKGNKILVKVGEKSLTQQEMQQLLPNGLNQADSQDMAEKEIQRWIREELLLRKARQSDSLPMEKIEEKVANFRRSLLAYHFKEQLIADQLDTAISEAQMRKYYKQNLENLQLKEELFRLLYLRIPKDAPDQKKLRRLLQKAPDSSRIRKIKSYALRFSQQFLVDEKRWQKLGEAFHGTYLSRSQPYSRLKKEIDQRAYVALKDPETDYYHFVKVLDKKKQGQASPFNYIREDIRRIILNRRKKQLLNNFQEELLRQAENQGIIQRND